MSKEKPWYETVTREGMPRELRDHAWFLRKTYPGTSGLMRCAADMLEEATTQPAKEENDEPTQR